MPDSNKKFPTVKKKLFFCARNETFEPILYMITFQNKKTFSIDKLNERDKTISTLLVPAHLIADLKEKLKAHGNSFSAYFRNLLSMYRAITHSGMLPEPKKIKTEYQEEGMRLVRVSFRPANADWIEIGELAIAFGKSRCWIFTHLLELDLLGLWKILSESGMDQSVPTKKRLLLRASWSLWRVLQYFERSYYVRV